MTPTEKAASIRAAFKQTADSLAEDGLARSANSMWHACGAIEELHDLQAARLYDALRNAIDTVRA